MTSPDNEDYVDPGPVILDRNAPHLLTMHLDEYVPPKSAGCFICFGEGLLFSDDPEDDGTECGACQGTGIPGGRRA